MDTKAFKTFIKDPASQINSLNTIIPALIKQFGSDSASASDGIEKLIEALMSKKIIDEEALSAIIFGLPQPSQSTETHKFVTTRLTVLFDNCLDQVTTIDHFDDLSKILLTFSQDILLKQDNALAYLSQSPNLLMSRLLVKAMKDQEELQLHFKKLSEQFLDIALASLLGLNSLLETEQGEESIKRKTLYSILNEFPVFDEIKKVKTTLISNDDEGEGLTEGDKELIKICKEQYERAYLNFLSRVSLKQADLVKKILIEMPKKVILNFENPLILSDFLTHYLNQKEDVELQVLALRAIFILLEKHGLDYPDYYKKLYQMIKPQILKRKGKVEIQSIFNMPEKSRFLRLLDLSLRSPVLPTQLIASFLKRLGRIVTSFGCCFTSQDLMFIIAFSNNLIKRHPKTMRLIHRRSAAKDLHLSLKNDPYREDEEDPMETKALRSSLWELETIMREHYDSNVRQYAKVFKTDFLRKTAMTKVEEFTQVDPIDMLMQDLEEIDNEKEGEALKKNLLQKHGQLTLSDKLAGAKRSQEEYIMNDQQFNDMMDRANAPTRKARFAEAFEDVGDMFSLMP